jgi:hypothetical protein
MDIAAFHRHGKSEAQMQDHKSFCELPILATELESGTCIVSKTSVFFIFSAVTINLIASRYTLVCRIDEPLW